ncbi:MAG: CIA30 family protein [Phycisphaeraceae bacterium]
MSKLPFLFRLAPCAFAAALFLMPLTVFAETDISRFGDERETFKNWYAVNDTVMGGVSKGRVALSDEGHLVFTGDLSMKNNGGFASIRTRDVADMLEGNNTLNVRLRGDGRMYYLALRDENRGMAASHRKPIMTKKDKWIDVSINLDEFKYTRFGRDIERADLTPSEVISMGFTLSDKKPGPFKLEIASITASKTAAPVDDSSIVGIAQSAGNFKTLIAAVQAAGLADALSKADANLTVFAPTDDAFAALPKGTVAALLKDENRQQLVELLLNHVVEGEVTLTQQVTTPAGEVLIIESKGGATIGGATILQADIRASNGIVHAIDRVLLPKSMQDTAEGRAMRLIKTAISQGVPAYNQGHIKQCASIYETALKSLAKEHRSAIGEYTARMLDINLTLNSQSHSDDDKAWSYRDALDDAYDALAESTR